VDVQAATDHQRGNLVDDLVIGELGDLPCVTFVEERGAQGLHLQNICLELKKTLAKEKAILATKIRVVIPAFGLSAEFPVARPNHARRLCGNYMSMEQVGFLAPGTFRASPCVRCRHSASLQLGVGVSRRGRRIFRCWLGASLAPCPGCNGFPARRRVELREL
jgi:hypothetical protein